MVRSRFAQPSRMACAPHSLLPRRALPESFLREGDLLRSAFAPPSRTLLRSRVAHLCARRQPTTGQGQPAPLRAVGVHQFPRERDDSTVRREAERGQGRRGPPPSSAGPRPWLRPIPRLLSMAFFRALRNPGPYFVCSFFPCGTTSIGCSIDLPFPLSAALFGDLRYRFVAPRLQCLSAHRRPGGRANRHLPVRSALRRNDGACGAAACRVGATAAPETARRLPSSRPSPRRRCPARRASSSLLSWTWGQM